MEHTSVASLVVVLIVAFLTPLLLHRFKLSIPVVVAEIIMGLIIGKSGLNLVVQGDTWLETLSVLGFIFLMFLSGLEIDFSSFEKGKKKQFLPNGKEAPNTFSAALIIFFGHLYFIIAAVLRLCLSRFYSKRIFNDAYYFDDITRSGGSDLKRRKDHELQYRPDHFACRRYCGLGDDDSARFLLFSLRRRQRKYVASFDSLCRGSRAVFLRQDL